MRLFIAINFPPEFRAALLDAQYALRSRSLHGNYSTEQNLHLTLAFIGKSERVADIRNAIDACRSGAFEIKTDGAGNFGSLYYVGIDGGEPLLSLVRELRGNLMSRGIRYDPKPFRPHVTLVREIRAEKPPHISVPEASVLTDRVSLMVSERVGGVLRYRELYGRVLDKNNQENK